MRGGLLGLCFAAGLMIGCKSEEKSGGLSSEGAARPKVALGSSAEPALAVSTDKLAKKMFRGGLQAVQRRDFAAAATAFLQAQDQHRAYAQSGGDEFVNGCEYYIGRANEGLFQFEAAKIHYDRVLLDSVYRPYAADRVLGLSRDSDGDGYADAWEDAEGTNPQNPLSHP